MERSIKYIDWLFSLYDNYVDKKEHMLQAAHLAYINNENRDIILACLFHDIGYLLASKNNIIIEKYELYAAKELRKLSFRENICSLIEKQNYLNSNKSFQENSSFQEAIKVQNYIKKSKNIKTKTKNLDFFRNLI